MHEYSCFTGARKDLPGFQWVNIALTTAYACAPVSGVLSEAVFVVVVVAGFN